MSVHSRSRAVRSNRTMGVWPMRSTRLGHVHGRAGLGDAPDLDAHQRPARSSGNGLVGEELGGQPGPPQPGRHRRRPRPPGPYTPTRRGMRARSGADQEARAIRRARVRCTWQRSVLQPGGAVQHRRRRRGDRCRLVHFRLSCRRTGAVFGQVRGRARRRTAVDGRARSSQLASRAKPDRRATRRSAPSGGRRGTPERRVGRPLGGSPWIAVGHRFGAARSAESDVHSPWRKGAGSTTAPGSFDAEVVVVRSETLA